MFQFPPKISLAQIPTPILPLPRIRAEWGVDIRVKRDDLTGSWLSGNKVRKLEYLLAEAQNQGADSIISCGATTSNHARATVLAARQLGMEAYLVLAGDPPSNAHGNLQLDLLAGSHVEYISWDDYTLQIDAILEKTAETLRQQGKKPYVIPTGGSTPLGLMGYVEAMREIQEQCQAMCWKPDWVLCAVGSGGTYAGMYLGNVLFPVASQVTGILVCGTVEGFRKKIAGDVQEACRIGGIETIDCETIHLVDGYYGKGYAQTSEEQIRFYRHLAEKEGLILEPVYTGKAFWGLRGEIEKKKIPTGANVLFLHSGGLFGLSAFCESMNAVWPSMTYWSE